LIEGGRQAIDHGVNPELAANSDQLREDLKYAVVKAHGENLRGLAAHLDEIAQKKLTPENIERSERAFQNYSNWNGHTTLPIYNRARKMFPNMEEEVPYNINNIVDYRENFIRANNHDMEPHQIVKARQEVKGIQAAADAQKKGWDQYSEDLRKAAPRTEFNITNDKELDDAVSKILNRRPPCV
jgi:hypothetical protein